MAGPRRRRAPRGVLVGLALAAVLATGVVVAVVALAGSPPPAATIDVFPVAGDRVAAPSTQISFRGASAGRLGRITVIGSKSGVHTGVVLSDSDGRGGSFVPSKAFEPGETVTVRTGLQIAGGRHGVYTFTVATPAGAIPMSGGHSPIQRTSGDVWRFVSRPDLTPAAVVVDRRSAQAAPGDLFVASQEGPLQDGPELLGPDGGLVYFKPVPAGQSATDFRAQTYHGRPVLTWWQGQVSAAGIGVGEDEIYDSSYRPLAVVKAGNGLAADLHEFELTPQNTALITAEYPVYWNASAVKGAGAHAIVLDSVVQEIDIRTGLVLYQWDSLDHVPVTASYQPPPTDSSHPWDYFHINSVQQQTDGSLLVSSRDTWAVYDVSPRTGGLRWTLGGKDSSFRMGRNARFAFQHHARMVGPGEMTLFDDGAGPPVEHQQSRGLTLKLNMRAMTATVARQEEHDTPLRAAYEGSDQRLPNGDDLVGWGQQPYLTEYDPSGREVFDARFVDGTDSYRAFRLPWAGTPATLPAAAVRGSGAATTVYASWNGTTRTQRWRVLAGSSTGSLTPVTTVAKTAFETAIRLGRSYPYVQVQALGAGARVLGASRIIQGSNS